MIMTHTKKKQRIIHLVMPSQVPYLLLRLVKQSNRTFKNLGNIYIHNSPSLVGWIKDIERVGESISWGSCRDITGVNIDLIIHWIIHTAVSVTTLNQRTISISHLPSLISWKKQELYMKLTEIDATLYLQTKN